MFTLSQIIQGYTLNAQARQLSPHTIADYHNTFRKLAAFLENDLPFDQIAKSQLERFLASQTVSKKTLLNYHTGLSSLWRWAVEEGYAIANLPRQIDPPHPGRRTINPFSDADLRAIVNAISSSKTYSNHGTIASNVLPNQDRNRAIILLLLDTGLRADELCSLAVRDVDLHNRFVHVASGKGDSERFVPFSPRTAQALWKYLASRTDKCRGRSGKGNPQMNNFNRPAPTTHEPFFITLNQTPLDRHRLLKQLRSLGRRAGVANVHPHRFRHTFAILYLRNGGDPYSLQVILGHATMEMVKKYLQIAKSDLENFHRLASPVANLRL